MSEPDLSFSVSDQDGVLFSILKWVFVAVYVVFVYGSASLLAFIRSRVGIVVAALLVIALTVFVIKRFGTARTS